MKAVCHYCKDKELAEQSNNLCVDCFNWIVMHYAQQKAGTGSLSGNAVDRFRAGVFGKNIYEGEIYVKPGLLPEDNSILQREEGKWTIKSKNN